MTVVGAAVAHCREIVGVVVVVVTVVGGGSVGATRCTPCFHDVARRCDDPVVGELAQVTVIHLQRVPKVSRGVQQRQCDGGRL